MNDFDEDKWSAEQRRLDGRIAQAFEGLESAYASFDGAANWHEACVADIAALRAEAAQLTHEGRRKHWAAELTRLGVPAEAPKPKAVPIRTTGGKSNG